MRTSLTHRFSRTLFLLILANTAILLFVVDLFVDDVEDTILSLELQADADFFIAQIANNEYMDVKTARLESYFIPEGSSSSDLPGYLKKRSVPFSREIVSNGKTYLIFSKRVSGNNNGVLYLAQDISIMEKRELLVRIALFGVAGLLFLVGFLVSWFTARYLAGSFKKLTFEVLATQPGHNIKRIFTDYHDLELFEISTAFNRFLAEIEGHINRESSFVKLASHELRTPIAVMSGALDVLEMRGSMSYADQKTLARVRRSLNDMRDDTEALLELARNTNLVSENNTDINIIALINEVVSDLEASSPQFIGRISIHECCSQPIIKCNLPLIRMLFRNLLQNALRHTSEVVSISVDNSSVLIADSGPGLPAEIFDEFNNSISDTDKTYNFSSKSFGNSRFGLLIVRLICERVRWTLDIESSNKEGTKFFIWFHK